MILQIVFKVGVDCAVGVANTVSKSFIQLAADGITYETVNYRLFIVIIRLQALGVALHHQLIF